MTQILVVAKAPLCGSVKTRLGAEIGMQEAAEVAAAALLDTLAACTEGYGATRCHLALAGELGSAVRGEEIAAAVTGWSVFPQRGDGFAERLVHAHTVLGTRGPGPVLQIGMDTPQVTPALLAATEVCLGDEDDPNRCDGVLGAATDGGWWILALRDARTATPLRVVTMSTPSTHDDTRHALTAAGLRMGTTMVLRDVDTAADARAVAELAPTGRFAALWRTLDSAR